MDRHGSQVAVLALGIAFTYAAGCGSVAAVSSSRGGTDGGTDGGADTGAIVVHDSGAEGRPDAADSGPAEAANDGPVSGPRGSLDPSFGGGTGIVKLGAVAPAFLGPHGLAVQPNGAIVYAGEYETSTQFLYALLAGRVLANGSVDDSFNLTGYFTAEQNGYWDEVGIAMTLVPGGGMQIDGFIDPDTEPNHEMFTVRLTASGQLDALFGGGTGFVAIADNNVDAKADAVLLQPDGKLLLAGFQGPQGAIARLAADGTLDPSFGAPNDSGATGAVGFAGLGMIAQLGQLKNGDLLAASSENDFVVAALKPDGTIDPNYGNQGLATVTLQGPLTAAIDMVVLDDGSAVCVSSTATTLELVRFTPQGGLDANFGNGGRASVPSSLTASGLAMLPDGSFAVAVLDPGKTVGVARFTPDGLVDTAFVMSGFKTLPVAVNSSAAIAIDGAGRIVLGTGTDGGVVLARLFP
jgi:uncharacterized delta-60 repeat protein